MLLTPSDSPKTRPLVLDLDGTLLKTDTFHEMMLVLLRTRPWVLLRLPFWFLKGRAYAKAQLVTECHLNWATLPYNVDLLTYVKDEMIQGRSLILATGSDQKVAEQVATHFGFFDDVIGSDGTTNMTGHHKRTALVARYGCQGFDYAGDSDKDPVVWEAAYQAIVVSPKAGVLKKAAQIKSMQDLRYFPQKHSTIRCFLQSLRPLFWAVNLLAPTWMLFVGFSFATSGLLMLGDLLSVSVERNRNIGKSAFAEGHLNLVHGMVISFGLIVASTFLLSPALPFGALLALGYFLLFGITDQGTRFLRPAIRWSCLIALQLFFVLFYGQGL